MVHAWFSAGRPGRGLGRSRAVPAVLIAAALVAAATACTSSGSSGTSTAGSSPGSSTKASATDSAATATASASAAGAGRLTGAAATALLSKAIADTKAAPTLEVKDAGLTSGTADETTSFDLTLVRNVGCKGTIAQLKTQSMQLVVLHGSTWLKPSNAFYKSLKFSQAELALVANKWIKLKSSDSEGASMAQLCTFSYLLGSLKAPTGTAFVATPVTYDGHRAYEMTLPGQQGHAYITNSATPTLAELALPGGSGTAITFHAYDTTPTITAPSAAESMDGGAVGF